MPSSPSSPQRYARERACSCGNVVPGVAVGRVVLADRAPLALGEVRAPAIPGLGAGVGLCEAAAFGVRGGARRSFRNPDVDLDRLLVLSEVVPRRGRVSRPSIGVVSRRPSQPGKRVSAASMSWTAAARSARDAFTVPTSTLLWRTSCLVERVGVELGPMLATRDAGQHDHAVRPDRRGALRTTNGLKPLASKIRSNGPRFAGDVLESSAALRWRSCRPAPRRARC